jgi:hypothetical protein
MGERKYNKVAQFEYTVTDLIRALLGNGSINSPTYTGDQQFSGGVFYVVRAVTVGFYCWATER